MKPFFHSKTCQLIITGIIGSVWLFHGLYSKILSGIPRHAMIVERVLGEGIAGHATLLIGLMEILLGIWVYTRLKRRACALVQTLAIFAMNSLEIILARDLLISALGMVALNSAFISLIWYWALAGTPGNQGPASQPDCQSPHAP
jgi:hypothetical protein